MAFIAGTQVFTNSGWKNIEDVAGLDKVLVRNFIGDAEFIQPFALKKRQYDGEIAKIGGKNWSLSLTPEHIVVYDRAKTSDAPNFTYEEAEKIKPDQKNRIYRKFKYLPPEEYKKETITVQDEFGKRSVTVSNEDWFVLCGYVLCRGYLERVSPKKHVLYIHLNVDRYDYELSLLGDILDRIGVKWSMVPSYTDGRAMIRVGAKNTLASRLTTRLGSSKRKDMYLPDKMIYNSSKELATLLIETIIDATKRADTERGATYQFSTNNRKLAESLSLMGTLWGYGMRLSVYAKKGEDRGQGKLRRDVMALVIHNLTETYSPTRVSRLPYDGYVYSIELFDGQIYVRDGSIPVWVNPK